MIVESYKIFKLKMISFHNIINKYITYMNYYNILKNKKLKL